jgi:hypothetical protein
MSTRSRAVAATVLFAALPPAAVAASDSAVPLAAVKLVVSPSSALVDQSVDVRLTGVRPGRKVTLEATTLDFLKKR